MSKNKLYRCQIYYYDGDRFREFGPFFADPQKAHRFLWQEFSTIEEPATGTVRAYYPDELPEGMQ